MGNRPQSLRVLMIGNSFSICVGKHLPQMVRSVPGLHLDLTSLYIGGCPLQKHWENVLQTEQDPAAKQYKTSRWNSDTGECTETDGSIQDQLAQPWDIVTIQQASHESWNIQSYQPFFDHLVTLIRERVPGAEIVLQQTWAYRNSDERIAPDTMTWGFDQRAMYEKLTANYRSLARKYGLRLIPTGLAVQKTREGNYTLYPRPEAIPQEAYAWPDLPHQAHEVVGAYRWQKNQEGKMQIVQDSIHLNPRGEYLQSCVWFARLYGRNVSEIRYVPDFIGDDDAEYLKRYAQEAVDAEC